MIETECRAWNWPASACRSPLKTRATSVLAEMLVSADGQPLALRLTSTQ